MKQKQWFWIIIALAFLLRVWTLDAPFYGDENPWPYAAADHSFSGFNFFIQRPFDVFVWTSPPLAPLAYRFFTWFIGVSEVTMRLVPLIIGLINIWLTFLLARKLFDSRSALYSAGLMAVSFWHVLSSFMIEHDSSFLMLFWLLFFNGWVNYETTKRTRWLVCCGIVLGLALLTKLTGGLMLVALGIYLLWKHGTFKQPVITCAKILGIGSGIFLVFPIVSLLVNPDYLKETILHSGVLTIVPSLFTPVRMISYLLLWATPLLTGLALLSFWETDKRFRLFWSWAGVVVGFYFFTKYLGAIDRYMSVMIPALSVLGGRVLSVHLEPKRIKKVLFVVVPLLAVLVLLNLVRSAWIEHNISDYLTRALTLDWSFVFQFHGGGGPAFMTSFIPLGTGLFLCIVFFAWLVRALLKERPPVKRMAFLLFVSTAFAFNLFLVQAFIVKAPYPDVGAVTKEIVDYFNKEGFEGPVYANDMNLAWYFGREKDFYVIGDVYSDEKKEVGRLKAIIRNRGGTLIITDYPKHLKNDSIWELASACKLKKTFGTKKIMLGYVFACQ